MPADQHPYAIDYAREVRQPIPADGEIAPKVQGHRVEIVHPMISHDWSASLER
jgi:hypothetical protein